MRFVSTFQSISLYAYHFIYNLGTHWRWSNPRSWGWYLFPCERCSFVCFNCSGFESLSTYHCSCISPKTFFKAKTEPHRIRKVVDCITFTGRDARMLFQIELGLVQSTSTFTYSVGFFVSSFHQSPTQLVPTYRLYKNVNYVLQKKRARWLKLNNLFWMALGVLHNVLGVLCNVYDGFALGSHE